MDGNALTSLLDVAAGTLLALTLLVLLVAVCLPREKRNAILRSLARKWII